MMKSIILLGIVAILSVGVSQASARPLPADCTASSALPPINTIPLHVDGGVGFSCFKDPRVIIYYRVNGASLMRRVGDVGPFVEKGIYASTNGKWKKLKETNTKLIATGIFKFSRKATKTNRKNYWQTEASWQFKMVDREKKAATYISPKIFQVSIINPLPFR